MRGALVAAGLPAPPDSRSHLMLWFAGPYRAVAGHAGWVSTEPAALLAETRRAIHEDGGVRPSEHVAKELCGLGLAVDLVDPWLAEQPVRIVETS